MNDFIATDDLALLQRHGLADFDSLWHLQLDAVDEPNTGRGGWSSVYRLDLEGRAFYLKRQSNYLTRTLRKPFGEPTFAREFFNISRYRKLGIPALQAVFYGQRQVQGELRAMLMTRALDGWDDLDSLLQRWRELAPVQQRAILTACGRLARTLHGAGQVHGCFYPKHIFLRGTGQTFEAQLIDLEKTRPLLFGKRDRTRDLEPLLRRALPWDEADVRVLLGAYLEQAENAALVDTWLAQLFRRRSYKEAR
jgi:hypothetical protein